MDSETRVWVDAVSPRDAIEKALSETEDDATPNRRASIVSGDYETGRYLVSIVEDPTVVGPAR
jgi:hypothetical protein